MILFNLAFEMLITVRYITIILAHWDPLLPKKPPLHLPLLCLPLPLTSSFIPPLLSNFYLCDLFIQLWAQVQLPPSIPLVTSF